MTVISEGKILLSHTQRGTSFFFLIISLFLLLLFYYIYIFMKIIFIFPCSGMFRDVPVCSGMFRVPGFIDGLTRLSARKSEQMMIF